MLVVDRDSSMPWFILLGTVHVVDHCCNCLYIVYFMMLGDGLFKASMPRKQEDSVTAAIIKFMPTTYDYGNITGCMLHTISDAELEFLPPLYLNGVNSS